MNKNFTAIFTTTIFLTACTMSQSSCTTQAQDNKTMVAETNQASPTVKVAVANSSSTAYYKIEGDKVYIQPIQVYFDFDDALNEALSDNDETYEVVFEVVVNADRKLPKAIEAYMDEKGSASIYEETVSGLKHERAHLFKNIVVDKSLFEALSAEELSISINVYSSRKHYENNIINASFPSETVEQAVHNDVTIKATLL